MMQPRPDDAAKRAIELLLVPSLATTPKESLAHEDAAKAFLLEYFKRATEAIA